MIESTTAMDLSMEFDLIERAISNYYQCDVNIERHLFQRALDLIDSVLRNSESLSETKALESTTLTSRTIEPMTSESMIRATQSMASRTTQSMTSESMASRTLGLMSNLIRIDDISGLDIPVTKYRQLVLSKLITIIKTYNEEITVDLSNQLFQSLYDNLNEIYELYWKNTNYKDLQSYDVFISFALQVSFYNQRIYASISFLQEKLDFHLYSRMMLLQILIHGILCLFKTKNGCTEDINGILNKNNSWFLKSFGSLKQTSQSFCQFIDISLDIANTLTNNSNDCMISILGLLTLNYELVNSMDEVTPTSLIQFHNLLNICFLLLVKLVVVNTGEVSDQYFIDSIAIASKALLKVSISLDSDNCDWVQVL